MTKHESISSHRLRTALRLIVCLAACGPGLAASQEHNYSSDSINDLNILFRQQYAEARSSQVADVGPVIIVRGDNLVLLQGAKRTVGTAVHPNYHDLKAVAHAPLALFCSLENCLDRPLTELPTKKLAALRAALAAVASDLETAFTDPSQRADQTKLVQGCAGFIDRILTKGQCSAGELDDLVDQLRPLLVSNAAAAARIRLDNYHEQMQRWRDELSDDDWQQLYILIPGATMSRKNSLAVRYFAKLFEQEGEGNRVIYAESQFEEAQDLQLLGTHLLDSSIGETFFDDSSRMKRDLLGPFANAYLDGLDFERLRGPQGGSGVGD